MALNDYTGRRFGLLTVTGESERRNGKRYWSCLCDCGNTIAVRANGPKGFARSCGCVGREKIGNARRKHNETADYNSPSPEYNAWVHMRQRCFNPNDPRYKDYGGRGITIAPEWDDYSVFRADMGKRPSSSHSLDRKDNNGPYCQSNCRWATTDEQAVNKRPRGGGVTFEGKQWTIRQLSQRFNKKPGTVAKRLRSGMTLPQALELPHS